MSLAQKRREAPSQHIEATFSGPDIVADDGQGIGRRRIPARREIGNQPMRRDGEDEPDLADIGGQTDAATHALIIAQPGHVPKRPVGEGVTGSVPSRRSRAMSAALRTASLAAEPRERASRY